MLTWLESMVLAACSDVIFSHVASGWGLGKIPKHITSHGRDKDYVYISFSGFRLSVLHTQPRYPNARGLLRLSLLELQPPPLHHPPYCGLLVLTRIRFKVSAFYKKASLQKIHNTDVLSRYGWIAEELLHIVISVSTTKKGQKRTKTYNSAYSLVVTHPGTNAPVSCLSTAERTGSAEFKILWSYVQD